MCNVLDVREARAEALGEARGEARGEVRGAINTLISLVEQGYLDVEVAARQANMDVAEFAELLTNANAAERKMNRGIRR